MTRDDIRDPFRGEADVLVVGAGMAGLTAAEVLRRAGRDVLVVDKGRGVGGRMASRRIGEATFDHGAQFMTAEDVAFAETVARWREAGVVEDWYRDVGAGEGYSRRRGRPSMSGIAKHLGRDLDVRCSCRVSSLRCEGRTWIADLESGEAIRAEAVILTAPVPQARALLDAGGVALSVSVRKRLDRLVYERCLAVLAVLDGPSRIPAPGLAEPATGPIALLVDNMAKGVSRVPAVTIHATPEFSLEAWDRNRDQSGRDLLEAAAPWLGSAVTDFQVHGWRFSRPTAVDEELCLFVDQSPSLVLAGDAFAGPRIESAALSGAAAAEVLLRSGPPA